MSEADPMGDYPKRHHTTPLQRVLERLKETDAHGNAAMTDGNA